MTVLQKNITLWLAVFLFPFAIAYIKTHAEVILDFYKLADRATSSKLVSFLFFAVFHFWGSWVALAFIKMDVRAKVILGVLITTFLSYFVLLFSFAWFCSHRECVMP